MLELSTLGEYLKKNPRSMDDRAVLQSILRDIFPQDKRTVNLLLMGFDEKIFSLVGTNPTCERLSKLVRTIMDNYGVGEESAVYIIETWLGEVFHETLPKGFGNHVSSASEPSSSSSSALSVDDVWEIFFNTHRDLMQKYRIVCSEDIDESLKILMKQRGIEYSEDKGKWDIVRNDNPNRHLYPKYEHYSRSPSQWEKSLIVKRLGKGRYQEKDFAYIRTSEDMSQSWGITYDSLIIPHVADAVIPFDEIDYMDPDYVNPNEEFFFIFRIIAGRARPRRRPAIKVTRRNGKSYILEPSDMMADDVKELFQFYQFLKVIKGMV